MQESKLIKVLKLLDKEELRRFKKLLQSSFFTTNEHLPKLYTYLIKYAPEFVSPKLNKPLLFAYLFPGKQYNDNKLRMLLRAFTRHLEDFLVIKEVRNNEKERKKQLIHIYGKRSQMELFEKGTFRLLEEMKLMPIKDKNHFFEQQQLIQELVYHPATKKSIESVELQTEMLEHLELHYWSNKIWLSCNLLNAQQFIKIEYNIENLEVAITRFPSKYLEKHPPLTIFIKAFTFLKVPSERHYFELKTIFLNQVNKIGLSDKRDIHSYLSNYTVRQYNQGNLHFLQENFEWNNFGLKHKLLIEEGRMDENIFKNFCLLAIRLKAFDWVEKFITDYRDFLNEKNKQDVIKLCQAYLYFYNENYLKLIDVALNYQFNQFRDNLGAKGLLLRSYFKLFLEDNSYLTVFTASSYNYEKFLRRNKLMPKDLIDEYLNFNSILRKLAKLINEKKWNTVNQEILKRRIEEERMALKQWLLDTINNV